MVETFLKRLQEDLEQLKKEGLYKEERIITSPQSSVISTGNKEVINLCSNNYLALSNHPAIKDAVKASLDERGFGLSSVRFICGTQDVHKELEKRLSAFLQTEDTILYSSCFDANGGLFETILTQEDAIISDALNHASIIDGVRLSKAKRFRYKNNDLKDLEEKLQEAKDCRVKLIATDGVFSMDGVIADLKGICELKERYGALLMVDDSHATGFLGAKGKGSHEYNEVLGKIDILTGTLGKALGGASGGYTSGRKEIISMLRQRSRPYLFSNSLAPMICRASLCALDLLENDGSMREVLWENTEYFRSGLLERGFTLYGSDHPIIPVAIDDATLAGKMADLLLQEGIYVVGFSYPVVPKGKARIRTQISAGHTKEELKKALMAFEKVARGLKVIC